MSSTGPTPYFDTLMLNRQRLLWAVASRLQLERWEPYVAADVLRGYEHRQLDDADIWLAQIEHHFALIAARNLLRALDLEPASSVVIDSTMRSELIEGRDLHEHWVENLPVFNITPRQTQPGYRSGRDFAKRHPTRGPYDWLSWSNKTGARLMPNVPASALHKVLDDVEAEVIADDAALARFIPPRAPSPWLRRDDEWWPDPGYAGVR
jgi:hypothetical protein